METQITHLANFRLPDYPTAKLHLDASPLSIIDTEIFTEESDTGNLTPAIGIATVLYKWCPNALTAFLDLDAWFSMTWTLGINEDTAEGSKIEIGRIGNQITFGSLDSTGDNWTLMLTYNIVSEGEERGKWIPNPKESMLGEQDVTDLGEIERLGRAWVKELVLKKRWETGKKMRHRFFVEYAPMDVWGDGIPMNPHWLYRSLNLTRCTTCDKREEVELQRCGRCGTATYCSDTCQRRDWAVHKDVCNMSMEDRGQAIKITEKGGLIGWDENKTYAQGEGEMSGNLNMGEGVMKRIKAANGDSTEKSG
ncbi:hypothetical protein EJ02DRAFT_432461 [Clathrospora elynae]|uniref:MYND-type domain-containing protein n=1 Tax=Clathrospora elynae TaxID=706981 RepID=A0A6A5SWU9_9PLEO|nr:hypothetical protein EJ02DRAFT_432461 [Clathrospora elynae]